MPLHWKQRFSREKSEIDCLYHSHSKFLNVGCNVAIIAEVRSSCWSYGPCIVWPQNCTKLLPILISSTGLTFDSWPAINRCMGQEEKTLLVAVNFFIQSGEWKQFSNRFGDGEYLMKHRWRMEVKQGAKCDIEPILLPPNFMMAN